MVETFITTYLGPTFVGPIIIILAILVCFAAMLIAIKKLKL